jgi:2-oxoglutarate dehydrogenase E2 component (dihydrolipoamide succinyltransferase)
MTDVVMPKMGESITEGTILEWKKQVGDSIAKDETLLEISTDKVDSDIPSPATGTIVEIVAQVNDTIPVGDVIARIGEVGESIAIEDASVETAPTEETVAAEPEPVPAIEAVVQSEIVSEKPIIQSGKRFYSPLVKSIAKKEGITQTELDALVGTGNNGRVNKQDILAYLKTGRAGASTLKEDVIEPMSRMRKKIADHMVQSLQTSAHVYTVVEADVTNMVTIRTENKESFKSKSGVNLTYTPMLLDACIRAIQEFPIMNASLDGDNIIHHRNINMGVAVALPDDNLIVPIIHSSEEKNFLGLARSVSDLSGRARESKLTPEEIFGSTFTITNPGVFGGLFGMGIINQPNVGILSVGSFQKRPVVKETEYGDTIVVRHMVYITLSYDHRIIDGAYGTKFLARLVEIIEQYNNDKIKN